MILIPYLDLGYAVTVEPQSYCVNYKVYELCGMTDKGEPLFENYSVTPSEETEVYLHGEVKWDGSSNWFFDEQQREAVLHGCSKKCLEDIGKIMAECWELTSEYCENFNP